MNNSEVAILADTGGDVSLEQAEKLGIELLPLHINYRDKSYLDMIEITPTEAYHSLDEEIPKTSIPSQGEILDIINRLKKEGKKSFIFINISSGLSGIYQSCCNLIKEEGLKARAFDTKGIGIMSGVLALFAAKLRNAGHSFESIVENLENNLKNTKGYYTIETLKYLVKGGRLGLVTGMLAGVLRIKPIISCNEDGVYYTVQKARGSLHSIKKLANLLRDLITDKPYELYLSHGDNPEALALLKEELKTEIENATVYEENQITAILGVHTGPGLIGGIIFTPEIL